MSTFELTEGEREELAEYFGYVPEPEPLEQMIAAVERIVSARLSRVWGYVFEDSFISPSSVNYAPSRESAIRKAEMFGGIAVTSLIGEWEIVE